MTLATWDARYASHRYAEYPDEDLLRFLRTGLVHKPGWALDLGCGAGRHLALLAKEGFQVVGVDGSAAALAIARRAVEGYDVILREDALERVRLPREHFVVACDVCAIQHLKPDDARTLVEKVYRSLQRRGVFFSKIMADDNTYFDDLSGIPAWGWTQKDLLGLFQDFYRVQVDKVLRSVENSFGHASRTGTPKWVAHWIVRAWKTRKVE